MRKGRAPAGNTTRHVAMEEVECTICAEPCHAVCVFQCGHFTCYACGLRIHLFTDKGCPACRESDKDPIITRQVSQSAEIYSADEVSAMLQRAVRSDKVKCFVDGDALASEVAKLNDFLCPLPGCWYHGVQDPFIERDFLETHLQINHHLNYCAICLQNRPVFLCEQTLYHFRALQQHLDGKCADDGPSFTGHPMCRFCKINNRFYDGDALLAHMQSSHYTCDICNRGQFTFTYYKDRNSLIQHFERRHTLCTHPDCSSLDVMMRVFANDLELAVHRQRVHGIKPKQLFAPGTTDARSTQRVGGADVLHSDTPATASNANIISITFDHVSRLETVRLVSTRAEHEAMNRHRRGRNGRERQQLSQAEGGDSGGAAALDDEAAARAGRGSEKAAYVVQRTGLPEHYHRAGVLAVMTRPCVHTSATNTTTTTSNGSDIGADGAKDDTRPTSSTANNTHAFGILATPDLTVPVATKDKTSNGGAQKNTGAATTAAAAMSTVGVSSEVRRQLEQKLNALIARELTSPVALVEMSECVSSYQNSKINTSELYEHLSHLFSKHDVFKEVFQLLIATIHSAEKRMAMQELWKIKMAPETQHMQRVREENERKAQEEAQWSALRSNPRGRNAKEQRKNAWFTHNIVQVAGGDGNSTPANHTWGDGAGSPMHNAATTSAMATYSGTLPSSSNAAMTVSDEQFPSLPRQGMRELFNTRKAPKKPNAWHRR